MKRFNFLLIFLLIRPLVAQSVSPWPGDFDLFRVSSPGSFQNGAYGFFNPALAGTNTFPEFQFYWMADSPFKSSPKQALFTGFPHAGFGLIRHSDAAKPFTDYRIALGGGGQRLFWGLGFGWADRRGQRLGRRDALSAGLLWRPGKHVSVGMTGSRVSGQGRAAADLALRPLGNDRLTLFGEAQWQGRQVWDRSRWAAGAAAQPLEGVHLFFRYDDSETVRAGLRFSLGALGLFAGQSSRGSAKHVFGFRFGAFRPNVADAYLSEGKYWLSLPLKGRVTYQRYKYFDKGLTLRHILATLKEAGEDDRVAGVAVDLTGFSASREAVWEIRQALQRVQAAGKPVWVHVDRLFMTGYHLASVADRLVLDPAGMVILEGMAMGRTFWKGLLDRLGLGYDEWRFFEYKSAFETYSKERMSEADREQRQALLDDMYGLVREEVSASRDLRSTFFDSLVDGKAVILAREVQNLGLADTLGRWPDVERLIRKDHPEVKGFLSPKWLAGRAFVKDTWGARPKVAVVYATGSCELERGLSARKLAKMIEGLAKEPNVKAVVVRVDSPGGDGLASDLVAEAMKHCKRLKPVIVSQGAVAASAGYTISMAADTILAAPNTVTGSIGVIGGWVWDKGFSKKLGLSRDWVKAGRHADLAVSLRVPGLSLPLPVRNLTSEERRRAEWIIRAEYDDFVRMVSKDRRLPLERVQRMAQGRAWSGRAGLELGLADRLGGLHEALNLAKEMAGIPVKEKVDVVELPSKGLFNPDFWKPQLPSLKALDAALASPEMEYLNLLVNYPGRPLYVLPPDLLPREREGDAVYP